MQFSTIATIAATFLLGQAVMAAPAPAADTSNIQKRMSCQACSIPPFFEGDDACCSASCLLQHENWHGGHCDDNGYCICN
ncbi:hypothetical protein FQN54_004361 [Arachnomyces sp. PD_36]|nr:hypothetical protein FQN54_004361 [Arachnomyces sp. PD_36]